MLLSTIACLDTYTLYDIQSFSYLYCYNMREDLYNILSKWILSSVFHFMHLVILFYVKSITMFLISYFLILIKLLIFCMSYYSIV